MTRYLGIDPGQTGALALINHDGRLVDVWDMPVVDKRVSPVLLADIITELDYGREFGAKLVAVVEQVASMPGQGVASTFKFGTSYGIVLGVIASRHLETIHVTPAKWKREMGLSKDKGVSRRKAIDRWPAMARWFARVKDDGRAEAALLALWAQQQATS